MQSQVKLMRINFKFEAPILQVQIITNIIYSYLIRPSRNVWGLYTFSQYVTQDKIIAIWCVVLPILEICIDREGYIDIYISVNVSRVFGRHLIFVILSAYTCCMSKFRVGDNRRTVNTLTSEARRVHKILISWAQKTEVKHCFWWFMSSGLR